MIHYLIIRGLELFGRRGISSFVDQVEFKTKKSK